MEPPPEPQNLVGTVNSDGSVTLTWEAPSDDSITGYRMILRRRPTEGEHTLWCTWRAHRAPPPPTQTRTPRWECGTPTGSGPSTGPAPAPFPTSST